MRHSFIILVAATLYLTLSGFDCGGSTQMTTAKIALQRKDFLKAAESLEKEVALRPANGDAWFLLGESYEALGRTLDMVNAFDRALASPATSLTAEQRENIYLKKYNAWGKKYNAALRAYGDKNYDVALAQLDTAGMLRPDFAEHDYFRATIFGAQNRESDALQTFTKYVETIQSGVDEGLKMGLALRMSQRQVESKLGAPTRASLDDTTGGFLYYAPKNLYVYFAPVEGGPPEVEGWKVYRDSVPEVLRQGSISLRSDPYVVLALKEKQAGATDASRYDKAIRYLQTLGRLDPQREGVSAEISSIYIKSNRTAEAMRMLRSEIEANPSDARAYIDLGNLQFSAKDYQGAAQTFGKVTGLNLPADDDNLQIALFNLGAVYKNWGAALQDSVAGVSNNRPTAAQISIYQNPLRESVKYFEQLHASKPDDFTLITELGNLYDVLGDKAKLTGSIRQLEALESANATKSSYWRAMSRLYAIAGDIKKAEAADKKADSLPN